MRVVCDTNVLVSGVLFGGPAREILRRASRGLITNLVSPAILQELEEVLRRRKFGLTDEAASEILQLMRDSFETIHPRARIEAVAADPADNRIVEAAVAGSAEFIVSGDRHLLSLGEWDGIPVLSPAQMLARLEG